MKLGDPKEIVDHLSIIPAFIDLEMSGVEVQYSKPLYINKLLYHL